MERCFRRFCALFVLVVATLAAVSGGASAAGWLPQVDASPPDDHTLPDLAVDAQGGAVAVWRQHVTSSLWRIVAATRPLGGRWSAPAELTPADVTVRLPRVAVDPAGNAVAVWGRKGASNVTSVWAARRPAGGTWGEPVEVADGLGDCGHDVVLDADGDATAIWCDQGDLEVNGYVVHAATLPAGGTWSDPVPLSGESMLEPDFALAVDDDGAATAIWTQHDDGADGAVVHAKRRTGGVWDASATDLSEAGTDAADPELVVDPQGDVTAAWALADGGEHAVQTARRPSGDDWEEPVDLTRYAADTGDYYPDLGLAVDPQGAVTAAWSPGGHVLRASTRAAGGAWSPPGDLTAADTSAPWRVSDPQVVVDPQGAATVTWIAAVGAFSGGTPSGYQLRSSRRASGGAWGVPADVSGVRDLGLWETAVDPFGYVTAIWSEATGFADDTVRSRVLDPIAPTLRAVTVPASGVAGQPVTMALDAYDLWSPVAASWQFGDGSSATGTSVAHCFATPGERTVTVTGTDAAGNATSASRTIAIAADPTPPADVEPCTGLPRDRGRDDDRDRDDDRGRDDRGRDDDRDRGRDPDVVVAPVLSDLRQSSARWRTQPGGRPRLPVGTTFRFRLDRAAQVRLGFERLFTGRRAGGRCVAPARANRGKPRCVRTAGRGAVTAAGRAGANAVGFRGRVGRRTLAPGRYRMRVTAVADGKRSPARTIVFTIAR
jgi:hypothetical protein